MTKEQIELILQYIELDGKISYYVSKNWKTGKLFKEKMEIKERLLLTVKE